MAVLSTAVMIMENRNEKGDGRMQEYEAVWEIFNLCANNQMRDVFIEEIECEDPELYIKNKFKDKELKYEKTVKSDGTIIFDIITSGIKQRYTFTPF